MRRSHSAGAVVRCSACNQPCRRSCGGTSRGPSVGRDLHSAEIAVGKVFDTHTMTIIKNMSIEAMDTIKVTVRKQIAGMIGHPTIARAILEVINKYGRTGDRYPKYSELRRFASGLATAATVTDDELSEWLTQYSRRCFGRDRVNRDIFQIFKTYVIKYIQTASCYCVWKACVHFELAAQKFLDNQRSSRHESFSPGMDYLSFSSGVDYPSFSSGVDYRSFSPGAVYRSSTPGAVYRSSTPGATVHIRGVAFGPPGRNPDEVFRGIFTPPGRRSPAIMF